jgi:hypothetical protein
MLTTL